MDLLEAGVSTEYSRLVVGLTETTVKDRLPGKLL